MESIVIHGGRPLVGTVKISGAKNAVLPILAATVRHGGVYSLSNCPQISDVRLAGEIIMLLGGSVEWQGDIVTVDTRNLSGWEIPACLMERMRASVLFLGAVLARFGKARLTLPGGCPLGRRPIDLHLEVMSQLGAAVTMQDGEIICRADRLHGGEICFPLPSVGATENFLLAATACGGEAILYNAAREPEIVDMAAFLISMGADIRGAGTEVIRVRGSRPLHDAVHRVLPDRIETATYLCAAAACGGDVLLTDTDPTLLEPVIAALETAGCHVQREEGSIGLRSEDRLRAVGAVITEPYPGFPTDAQALLMAALLRSQGETVITENVFDSRFGHVQALRSFGGDIQCLGPAARLRGVQRLQPARVQGTDLRGTAALILAALQAEGKSVVTGLEHLDRGYAYMEEKLQKLGAQLQRSRHS